MDLAVVYECSVCSAVSPAVVTDVTDPATFISDGNKKSLREIAATRRKLGVLGDPDPVGTMEEGLRQSSAKDALRYATCPRCGERNPAGVLERAEDRRKTRLIGTLASAVTAIGVWFFPWVAFVVVAIVIGLTVLLFVLAWRENNARWVPIATNVAFAGLLVAAAWFYPRAAALLPLVLAVRFAFARADEGPWKRAAENIRFDTPYR